jgi:hypothetical protein
MEPDVNRHGSADAISCHSDDASLDYFPLECRSLSAAVKVLVNQTACIAVWFYRKSGLRPPLLTEPQVSEDDHYDDYDPDDVEDVHDLPASCVISSRFSADRRHCPKPSPVKLLGRRSASEARDE